MKPFNSPLILNGLTWTKLLTGKESLHPEDQLGEAASLATGAPPRPWRGRTVRCAGPRPAVTATTGPTLASPAGLSSGGL